MSFSCLLKPNSVEITAGKNSTFSQQEKWHDSRRWQLSVATEQPELEGPREGYRNFRGQREGNRGFRGQREGNRGVRGQWEKSRSFRGQLSGGGNKSNKF